MNRMVAITGNAGVNVRSDCKITLELRDEGGIAIDLQSKVLALYGESIRNQCHEILNYFGIRNAVLKIDDSGALPFVISARLEAAIRQLISTDLEYLPVMIPENMSVSGAERFRITRLYLPGNTPAMMINAGLHSADGIILDLEDSVAPGKKCEARILVRNALRQVNFYGAERMVRINQGEMGLEDLNYVITHNVNLILVPKCEDAELIREVSRNIKRINVSGGRDNKVSIMPIIESALGIEKAFEIATSDENVVALAIGLEDYTADLGVLRTVEGKESLYARLRLINAAKAAGIQPLDSVFSNVDDMKALTQTVQLSRSLGFQGMGCIHPRQIRVIQNGFSPGKDEIEKAIKIIKAFKEAVKNGSGVTVLESKMIDSPVVVQAEKTINLAVRMGILSPEINIEKASGD